MKRNVTVGLVLVGIGAFLILQRILNLSMNIWQFVWPFFLLVPGISMHSEYFKNKRDSGSLVIAGILTVYGLFFLINAFTSWDYSHVLSFIYPLGIGIGFLESYAFGEKKNSYLSIGIVFVIVSIYMLINNTLPDMARDYKFFIMPIALIIIGLFIVFQDRYKRS